MTQFMKQKEEIIMKLVHYFITEENYEPMIVNGVRNEIWLENLQAEYKIIRINSNYIHNNDQLLADNYKIKNITKQITKKTYTFNMKTINLLLDVGEKVELKDTKKISNYKVDNYKDIRSDNNIAGIFPKLKTMSLKKDNSFDDFINITNDINAKSESKNKRFEKIFSPKKIVITKVLICLNILIFILTMFSDTLFNRLILDPSAVRNGEVYRLLTCIFMHSSILHLVVNMYSLSILGNQLENFLGKTKFIIIYLISGLSGSLLSCILTNTYSLGASGAIFGLLSSLLYFGFQYRLYLGSVLIKEILPVILFNLLIGFTLSGIDNAAHIGGLIGGLFITIALGVDSETNKTTKINGYITLFIYLLLLSYLLFFKYILIICAKYIPATFLEKL